MAEVTYIDHTADVGVRIMAETPAAAFVAAAEAMFDIMVPNRADIEETQSWDISVDAPGWEDLLVTWLEELLYHYEMERLVPARVEIREISPSYLKARAHGERLDPARHETSVQIKAVTYHQLRAEETDRGFEIQVIFDI